MFRAPIRSINSTKRCAVSIFFFDEFKIPNALSLDRRSNGSGTIRLDVTDHNNIDITPNFQIMVYQEPQLPQVNNFTNDPMIPRDFWHGCRPMTFCYDSTFVESHCTPQPDMSGSLQSYSILCAQLRDHPSPWSGAYVQPSFVHRRRTGSCDSDEVCITSFGARTQWASCVKKSFFDSTMYGPGESESKQRINRALEKGRFKGAYMVTSQNDGTTPTEVDTFNIDTWSVVGQKQSQKCRDCMDLQAKRFAPNMNALRAEARLLTTGAAAAGMLWLALIAG